MTHWFWYFLIYSFLGYGLEKLFARATHSSRRVRKCFLLLPLCPVYGLAMVAVLALSEPTFPFWVQAVIGGILCTSVEYIVHYFYDKVFQTRFWDYSDLPHHFAGRICPHFALIWGILSAVAVRWLHPVIAFFAASVSPALTFGIWMLLAIDCVLTAALLHRFHDTEILSLRALLAHE